MKTYIDIVCCLTWVFLKPMMSMLYFNINFTLSRPSFPLLLWKLLFPLSVAQNPRTKPLYCHNLFFQILWRLPLLSPKTFPFFLDTNFPLTSSLVWLTYNLCSTTTFKTSTWIVVTIIVALRCRRQSGHSQVPYLPSSLHIFFCHFFSWRFCSCYQSLVGWPSSAQGFVHDL